MARLSQDNHVNVSGRRAIIWPRERVALAVVAQRPNLFIEANHAVVQPETFEHRLLNYINMILVDTGARRLHDWWLRDDNRVSQFGFLFEERGCHRLIGVVRPAGCEGAFGRLHPYGMDDLLVFQALMRAIGQTKLPLYIVFGTGWRAALTKG